MFTDIMNSIRVYWNSCQKDWYISRRKVLKLSHGAKDKQTIAVDGHARPGLLVSDFKLLFWTDCFTIMNSVQVQFRHFYINECGKLVRFKIFWEFYTVFYLVLINAVAQGDGRFNKRNHDYKQYKEN